MKFYVVSTGMGSTVGCEFSKRKAVKLANAHGSGSQVHEMVITMSLREALRRELGQVGGNCESSELVHVSINNVRPTDGN